MYRNLLLYIDGLDSNYRDQPQTKRYIAQISKKLANEQKITKNLFKLAKNCPRLLLLQNTETDICMNGLSSNYQNQTILSAVRTKLKSL